MIISVINLSDGAASDAKLQSAIRAINRQIREDFEPYWGFGARLRLERHHWNYDEPLTVTYLCADCHAIADTMVWEADIA